jgi:hypothetical protein
MKSNAKFNSGLIGKSLFDFEVSNVQNVCAIKYKNWIIWPHIKFNLYYRILRDLEKSKSQINQSKRKIRYLDVFVFFYSFFRIFLQKKRKYIVYMRICNYIKHFKY